MYCAKCKEKRDESQVARAPGADGTVAYFCTKCSTTLETRHVCGPCGGIEVAPVVGLNGSGQIVKACPACSNPLGLALSSPTCATGKAVGADRDEVLRPHAPPAATPPPTVAVLPPPPQSAHVPTAHRAIPSTGDYAVDLRNRLSVVESAIAERRALEVEARMLRKMIAVADRAKAQIDAHRRVTSIMTAPAQEPIQ